MLVPTLQTARLEIRPLVMNDHEAVYGVFTEAFGDVPDLAVFRRWLEWTILGYEQHARLYQPPYGERAVCLRDTDELVGAVGYVPCLDAFGQMAFTQIQAVPAGRFSAEFGLFWAVSPRHQNKGYATEAARALVDYGFAQLNLARFVATTEYDNVASQKVMQKLGMEIEHNPLPTPHHLQVVGVLQRP